jgi:hypothetical protein
MRLPDDPLLSAWLDHRRREMWLLGGFVVAAGVVAIACMAVIVERGILESGSRLLSMLMVGIICVAFFPAAHLNRLWQRRRYHLDEETLRALDRAFGRAILQKRDPRRAPPDEAVAILKAALDETTGTTPTPTFSDAQLRAWFAVQRSFRRAFIAPCIALWAMSVGNTFIGDDRPGGTVSDVVVLGGLLAFVLIAFGGRLLYRRARAASGLSDQELGTLRAAAGSAGLHKAAGNDDDIRRLRAALHRP